MDDRLNRFRQLEKARERGPEGRERTSTSGRIDAVLGPGEKAPAVPPQAPGAPSGDEPGERAPASGAAGSESPPLSPEALAAMKGSQADLEAILMRELERQPMHAGRQITLWRSIMRRSVEELEGRTSHPSSIAFAVAAVLTAFTFGSCVVAGPRLWQLLFAAMIVFLLLRGRHH
jgi:hypothetical protein